MLPALKARVTQSGKFILTRKFIDGVLLYLRLWGGPVCVLMLQSNSKDENLDHVEVSGDELPFEVKVIDYNRSNLISFLNEDDLLLLSLGRHECAITRLPEIKQLAKVYISEYTLKTRIQIGFFSTKNPLKLIKRSLWESFCELHYRRAIVRADGIQCNGTPTFNEYKRISRNALLYFDTRVPQHMLATEQIVMERSKGEALRLVFSGRLNSMKGADHLIEVAKHLVVLGVTFELKIFGAGTLESSMRKRVESLGLSKFVIMTGVLDFNVELVPFIKKNADIFVCCHRQGDPSCTYLETMSCGVPIIGYNNEAFRGVVEASNCGWITPMDAPLIMAQKIAELSKDRSTITKHSLASLHFARQHTFESTFARRIDHLKDIASAKKRSLLAQNPGKA